MNTPYNEGKADCEAGYSLSNNPYKEISLEGIQWSNGWLDAFIKECRDSLQPTNGRK